MSSPLTGVLDAIARAVLGDGHGEPPTLGAITLRAHQYDALCRIRESIDRCGGALLADDPGLGKTFVALALAREAPQAVVVAPAALREMWINAAAAAGLSIPFVSMEALSRRDSGVGMTAHERGALVIVDEAHHVCNPRAARYARLARMIAYHRVLLVSATPVRNRRAELGALLALFMGPRAYTLDAAAKARCIVRRRADASLLPAIDGPHWHRVPGVPRLGAMIAKLPPPLPALDGREALAILRVSLARCWASSLAALDAALQRRLLRGEAFRALLDDGRVPARAELRSWVLGDDGIQLAFPMFAAHRTPDALRLRAVLDAHLDAVRAARAETRGRVAADSAARARVLLGLRRAHAGARIVAFTAHAATAAALYRALARNEGVALLTALGARTAGGARPRADVIATLGADSRPLPVRGRDAISLVIATDLLSEGVNLQGASVIVHLDIPWTPAGLVQRVGRAVRMGSSHLRVHVHGFATPAGAERLLRLDQRLVRKRSEQAVAAGAPGDAERLRATMRTWRNDEPDAAAGAAPAAAPAGAAPVATAPGVRRGFMAVVAEGGDRIVVCGLLRGRRRWKISDRPADLADMALAVDPRHTGVAGARPNEILERAARTTLERWLASRHARSSGGASRPSSRARRLLLGRIDAAVRRATAHTRATHAAAVARVRGLIDRAVSVGAECALGDLARIDAVNLGLLLAACEARLGAATTHSTDVAGAPPALIALLLLDGRG